MDDFQVEPKEFAIGMRRKLDIGGSIKVLPDRYPTREHAEAAKNTGAAAQGGFTLFVVELF